MGISLFLVRNSLLWSENGGKMDGLISGDCKRYLYLSYTASSVGFVVTIYKDSAKFRLSKEKAKNFSFKGQKETED